MFGSYNSKNVEYISSDGTKVTAQGNEHPHHLATRGFAQTFGLLPMSAFLVIAADLMLHTADVVSAGLLVPFSAAAAFVVGVVVFLAQRKFYNDDQESAVIKALIVGLLTAIPSPLPYPLFISAGIVGLFRRKG